MELLFYFFCSLFNEARSCLFLIYGMINLLVPYKSQKCHCQGKRNRPTFIQIPDRANFFLKINTKKNETIKYNKEKEETRKRKKSKEIHVKRNFWREEIQKWTSQWCNRIEAHQRVVQCNWIQFPKWTWSHFIIPKTVIFKFCCWWWWWWWWQWQCGVENNVNANRYDTPLLQLNQALSLKSVFLRFFFVYRATNTMSHTHWNQIF